MYNSAKSFSLNLFNLKFSLWMHRWWHYVLSWRFLLCAGIVKAVGSWAYVWNLSMQCRTEEKKCTQNPKQTKNNPHTLAFAASYQCTVSSSDRNPANEFWNQNQYCSVFCLNLLIVCHGFVWTPVWWWDCKNDAPLPYWEVPANFVTLKILLDQFLFWPPLPLFLTALISAGNIFEFLLGWI